MGDALNNFGEPMSLQGMHLVEIPSGSDYEPGVTFTILVGNSGDVKCDGARGGTAVLKNLPEGATCPVLMKKIYNTGTTATDLVAFINN
jgi:hypothetical protein